MFFKRSRLFNRRQIIVFILFAFAAGGGSHSFAQTEKAVEFTGKFEPELRYATSDPLAVLFKPVTNLAAYKFARPVEKGASVTIGRLYDPRDYEHKLTVLLVAPPGNVSPSVCADLNRDAVFTANECQPMTADEKGAAKTFETVLALPITNLLFKTYPLYLKFLKGYQGANVGANENVVVQSTSAFAIGRIRVRDRSVLVEYGFNPQQPTISTTTGLFGMDANGDGKIAFAPFSLESSYVSEEEAVFRLGDLFISTSQIDLAANRIVLRERAAADYRRVELTTGAKMPDFAFTDFADKKRSSSEFRGKYLLVDFWGLWCIDCRRELPFQLAAYEKFRTRGFEILALDDDEDFVPVKTFLAEQKITWTQAKKESIKDLLETAYRIQEYPSAILLAPDGKVLVLDQTQLRGAELLETLDRLLPR